MDDPMDEDGGGSGQGQEKDVVVKKEEEGQESAANKPPILPKPGMGGAALPAGSVKRLGSVREGGPDLSMVFLSPHSV
jgi:hypothetical protein